MKNENRVRFKCCLRRDKMGKNRTKVDISLYIG